MTIAPESTSVIRLMSRLALRCRWLHAPVGLLVVLLQRTPALRLVAGFEYIAGHVAGDGLKYVFTVAALGAYNSLAGATTFSVSGATPASGSAGTTFTVPGTTGTALNVSFTVTGAPGNPRSWSVTGALPAGLSVTGGNPVNVTAPYKMTITGTPTMAGSSTVTVTAWDTAGGTGKSANIRCTFNITGGMTMTPPSFSAHPVNTTVTAGSAVTFSATAGGAPPPAYQWQKGGVDIAGATASSYTIASAQAGDAGTYRVVATNSAGTAASNGAVLTINAAAVAPSISAQPQSATVTAGGSASFSVTAGGTAPLSYQWQKGGANIAGATSAAYAIASAQTGDAGSYTVVVSNSVGAVTSNAATLTVSAAAVAPTITAQPQNLAVAAGAAANFSVTVAGTGPLSYQWRRDSVNLVGATAAGYSIASAQTSHAGSYTVVVSNSAGQVTSLAATLTVNTSSGPAPVVSTNPLNQTVATGRSVSFSVGADGATGYQWQVSADGGLTWSNVANNPIYSGATTSRLTITNAGADLNGYLYRATASNSGGSVSSANVMLTVAAPVLPGPTGVWVEANGRLVVSDSNANLIQAVVSGQASSLAGVAGQQGSSDGSGGSALFRAPGGVAIDTSGNAYLADTGNSLIRRISASGAVTTIAGSASNQGFQDGAGASAWFNTPADVAVDRLGVVYVADTGNSVVRRIAVDGTVTTFAGLAGQRGGTDGTGAAARFNQPGGIAVDAGGDIYVADTFNHTIRKITPSGAVSTLAGVSGISGVDDGVGAAALFNQPGGLALDAAGSLYVADTGNNTIRVIAASGAVRTLAGLPTVAGLEDGAGLAALFNQPKDLSLDTAGNVYVADFGNAAIRKVTPGGVVSTLSLSQASSTPPSSVPTPPAPSTGSGGATPGATAAKAGGGAMSVWFLLLLAGAAACRRRFNLPA